MPGLYHGPTGFADTVPLPTGLTLVIRRYWVEKEAVYDAGVDGTVMVWVWDKPSLQLEKTYWIPVPPD